MRVQEMEVVEEAVPDPMLPEQTGLARQPQEAMEAQGALANP
jgi:hypothetical protein